MADSQLDSLKGMFLCETDACRRNVDALIEDSVRQMGREETVELREQWRILSWKLNNTSKLTCLGDRNHRLMLLEFVRAEAVLEYKSSYFNRAKIRAQYIEYLQRIGPYVFAEVITIVNKLKLIKKFHSKTPSGHLHQDHISLKVKQVLDTVDVKKRSQNSNIFKFIKIVEYEDREGLTKELGKILRAAWTKEKGSAAQGIPATEQQLPLSQESEVKSRVSASRGSRDNELELIGSYIQNYDDEMSQSPQNWI